MKKSLSLVAMTLLALPLFTLAAQEISDAEHPCHQDGGMMAGAMMQEHPNMGEGMAKGHKSEVGIPAYQEVADKVVHVTLTDSMQIQFEQPFEIKEGEVIEFVVKNEGKLVHEFVVGSEQEQLKHREMMKQMQGQAHHHNMPSVVTLESGKVKSLKWKFDGQASQVEFACNIIGHFEAGMTKTMTIQG